MGAARVLPPEGAGHPKLGVSRDAGAMELLALLVLGREFLPPEGVREGKEVRRDWLAERMHPDWWADGKKQRARESVRYRRDKLHEALKIRPAQADNTRERNVVSVSWANIWMDVLALRETARQLHAPPKQEEVIALADRPLLEGAAYLWLQTPEFQMVRAELDACLLAALARRADSLLVQREAANEAGRSAEADACRNKALPLLDKAADRLSGYGELRGRPEHFLVLPFVAQFADLRRRAAYAPPAPAVPPPARLPRPITSFVGREREMRRIPPLLKTQRLVTLSGLGGCGKTRLALEVAAKIGGAGECDVRMVELARLNDPAPLAQTVAEAFGLEVQKNHVEALIISLQGRPTLLLLDNCEHLLQACAELVETLLQACPDLKVLATSRASLKIDGEHLCPVPPLGIPDPNRLPTDAPDPVAALLQFDSVRLFLERVRPLREFTLSPDNMGAVSVICASLDGLPLALELAAARVRLLPMPEIAEMLTDRFHLLTDGRRTALPRHKTMRAVIDWSYDLLSEPEQELLCRLSVFAGGWTLDAAEAIGTPEGINDKSTLDLLASLVDKSLVIFGTDGTTGRYRMLETVRQYAQDRLRERGEWDETRRRHRTYFLALAEEAAPQLRGPEQRHWLDRLEVEHGNFRAALDWRADEDGLRLAYALQRFWWVRGYLAEGRKWLERKLDGDARISDAVRAGALIRAGRLSQAQGELAEAGKLYGEGLALHILHENKQGIAEALFCLGTVAEHLGDYADAVERHEESLRLCLEIGDNHGIANAWYGLAIVAQNQDEYTAAIQKHEQSLTLRRELGDVLGISSCLSSLGTLAYIQGRLEDARTYFVECLALQQSLGQRRGIANSTIALGELDQAQGDYKGARQEFDHSLALFQDIGDRYGSANAMHSLAALAYDEGDFTSAKSLMEQCLTVLHALRDKSGIAILTSNLGSIARHQLRFAESKMLLTESLAMFQQLETKSDIVNSLGEFAFLATAEGEHQRAARLWSAAEKLSELVGCQRPPNEEGRRQQALLSVREALGAEAFESAWAQGQDMTWEQAVALALGQASS